MDPSDTVHEAASKVLWEFCIEDGSYNSFLPGVKLALGFLSRELGDLDSSEMGRAMKDLKCVLNDSPSAGSLVRWAESHFGS